MAKRPEGIKVEFIGSSGPQCTVVPEEEEEEEKKRYSFIPSSPPPPPGKNSGAH